MQLSLHRLKAKNSLITSVQSGLWLLFYRHSPDFSLLGGESCEFLSFSPETRDLLLLPAVKACTNLTDWETGKKIQTDAIASKLHSDIYVANSLIHMFTRCGSMSEASAIFNKMPLHSTVSWNALILGYVVNGEEQSAFQCFKRMRSRGCEANHRTFVAVLMAIASLALREQGQQIYGRIVKLRNLEKGMAVHCDAVKLGCDSEMFVASSLVDVYAKCGSIEDAQRVFHRMEVVDVVTWNTLILGMVENREYEQALDLFSRMQVAPTARTVVAALMACAGLAAEEIGMDIDGKLVKLQCLDKTMAIHFIAGAPAEDDIYIANTLVETYAKCGSMLDARKVFDKMVRHNVVSWTALLQGYAENQEPEMAYGLFLGAESLISADARTYLAVIKACTNLAAKEQGKQLYDGLNFKMVKVEWLQKGMAIHSEITGTGSDQVDVFVGGALVDMYSKCGSMLDARIVFDRMIRQDVVTWTSLIMGYVENEEAEVGLQLFFCMQNASLAPDARTFAAALNACSVLAALEAGRMIHADYIQNSGLENDAFLGNCLVDFYGKCGSMTEAEAVFEAMGHSGTRSSVTWSTLIAGYSRQGDREQVFNLLQRMKHGGFEVNGITFLSILTACSHSGLVDRGNEYFEAMVNEYRICPEIEHYHCMADLLGRAGHLRQALAMVESMPFKPNVVTWKTVLAASRKWKNLEVGMVAFGRLVELDPQDVTAYLLMGSIYASLGMWEEQARIDSMRQQSLKQV